MGAAEPSAERAPASEHVGRLRGRSPFRERPQGDGVGRGAETERSEDTQKNSVEKRRGSAATERFEGDDLLVVEGEGLVEHCQDVLVAEVFDIAERGALI